MKARIEWMDDEGTHYGRWHNERTTRKIFEILQKHGILQDRVFIDKNGIDHDLYAQALADYNQRQMDAAGWRPWLMGAAK